MCNPEPLPLKLHKDIHCRLVSIQKKKKEKKERNDLNV